MDAFHLSQTEARITSRSVRSFVVRNGRITPAQQIALDSLMPVYGVDFQEDTNVIQGAFTEAAPMWLEIGFGNGDTLLEIATSQPDLNCVGIEVHSPGVGHLLRGIEERALQNLRILRHDAVEVAEHMVKPASVERILVLFPDPWPKKRHHKRRLIRQPFIDTLARCLKPGGVLHCATDWQPYADDMLERLQASRLLKNLSTQSSGFSMPPDYRLQTRFESRGQRLGHQVFDLLFERNDINI